jgi:hypothetical protein
MKERPYIWRSRRAEIQLTLLMGLSRLGPLPVTFAGKSGQDSQWHATKSTAATPIGIANSDDVT